MPELFLRAPDRTLGGQIDIFDQLETIKRFNDVGSFVLDLPFDSVASIARLGWGIVLRADDGRIEFSGPITNIKKRRAEGVRSLQLSGVDDNIWLLWRLASPQPATTAPPYSTNEFDIRTGTLSTIMFQFVSVNAGSSAIGPRIVSGLTMGADGGLGSTRKGSARWHTLLLLLQELAVQDGLGFDITQDGTDLVFNVYQPGDVSGTVIFSEELGSLGDYEYEVTTPTGDYAYAAGGGDGAPRSVAEGGDGALIADFGRIEILADAGSTTDATQLAQKVTETLASNTARSSFTFTPRELPQMRYGIDYNLGDKALAVIDDERLIDVIREVTSKITKDGVEVMPTLGTPNARNLRSQLPALYDRLVKTEQRVQTLERR